MILCILAAEEHVAEIRQKAKDNIPEFNNHPNLLNQGVSETGEAPATHWFCQLLVSQEFADRLIAFKELAEMELANPAEFLAARNLKKITS